MVLKIAVVVGALLAAGVAVALYALDPATAGVFPPCPVYAVTGWQCAGCGVLRGTHALLHGDVVAAWRLNPLFVMALPIVAALTGAHALRMLGLPLPAFRLRPAWVWCLVCLLVAFSVLRNL